MLLQKLKMTLRKLKVYLLIRFQIGLGGESILVAEKMGSKTFLEVGNGKVLSGMNKISKNVSTKSFRYEKY